MRKIFAPLCTVLLVLTLHLAALSQSTFYGEVTITDLDNTGNRLSIASDFNGVKYRDFQLTNGDPCVSAFGASSFLMYPQRTDDCLPKRDFYIYFPQAATDDLDFPAACKTSFDATRGLYYVSAWRMYFPELFLTPKGKQTTTPSTDVLFGFFCNGSAYSVQTDAKMTPTVSGSSRRLANVGSIAVKSSLYYPSNGNFYRVGVDNFDFTFDITVQNLGTGSTGGGKGKPSR